MQIFGWWKKRKNDKTEDESSVKKDSDICPDCGGKGYTINENHYIADDDFSRRYSSCKRCCGTGRYHPNNNY